MVTRFGVVTRGSMLGWLGNGAITSTFSTLLPQISRAELPLPAAAVDLANEVDELRAAFEFLKVNKAGAGSFLEKREPEANYIAALRELERTTSALFEAPSLCREDVLRKYVALEEHSYRGHWLYIRKHPYASLERLYRSWFDVLESDANRFKVCINFWWNSESCNRPMIDNVEVIWSGNQWRDARDVKAPQYRRQRAAA